MSVMEKIKNFVSPIDDDENELFEDENDSGGYEKTKSEALNKFTRGAKVILFEPRNFDEVDEIGKYFKGNSAVVINLHKLTREYAQRAIDFLTGIAFALDGTIQKIGTNVILCSPANMGVYGQVEKEADSENSTN